MHNKYINQQVKLIILACFQCAVFTKSGFGKWYLPKLVKGDF